MTRGRFVTLEGGEGAGKSTQAARLAEWLEARGIPTLSTREPGGSARAEAVRELLLAGRARPFGPDAEALLFAVARADHMAETIRPALAAGKWVICDRFMDSTRAYQGADGVDVATLDRLQQLAVGADRPDLTLILDLPPEDGGRRLTGRGEPPDRFEADAADRQAARRAIFLSIAKSEPERCAVVDAGQEPDKVHADIVGLVQERLLAGEAARES